MDNDHGFNQIFFDNVRVPKSGMVGEENQGWYVVAANLDFERSGIERIANNYKTYASSNASCGRKGGPARAAVDAIARHKLAEMAIDYNVGRLLAYRVAWQQSEGMVPNYEASMSKMYGLRGQPAHLAELRRHPRTLRPLRRPPAARPDAGPRGQGASSARSATPSPAAPRRSSATSSPPAASGCPASAAVAY